LVVSGWEELEGLLLERKSGSKIPHSGYRFLQELVYHTSDKSQRNLEEFQRLALA